MADNESRERQEQGPGSLEQAQHEELGRRVKARRRLCGLSQSDIGRALGVSFQQVQKYESGQNRIPALSLAMIAPLLETSVTELLAGLEPSGATSTSPATAWMEMAEGIELGRAFNRIDDPAWRQLSVALMGALADHANRQRPLADDEQRARKANGVPSIKTRRHKVRRRGPVKSVLTHR